jgi:hypothetical protein
MLLHVLFDSDNCINILGVNITYYYSYSNILSALKPQLNVVIKEHFLIVYFNISEYEPWV